MMSQVSLGSPLTHATARTRQPTVSERQRRVVEGAVAVLAFTVWGTLAYKGLFRVLARLEGVSLGGHWLLDVLSLVIGVSGGIAGIGAIWAIVMRALGRTPSSLIGAPDDAPPDSPYNPEARRRD